MRADAVNYIQYAGYVDLHRWRDIYFFLFLGDLALSGLSCVLLAVFDASQCSQIREVSVEDE